MTEELIDDLIFFINDSNARDADRHYSNYIFKPRHPGDTPEEKYLDEYNTQAKDLLNQLKELNKEDEDSKE